MRMSLANGLPVYPSPDRCDTDAVQFLADRVWAELELPIARAVHKRAAIAFAGQAAALMLPLRRGDTVVIDGSDETLAAGSTHPDAVEAWLAAGAVVRSLPGLHAKVILLKNVDGTRVAIVGSANASTRSRDRLIEAAVVADDEALCDAVSDKLDIWTALGDPLTTEWISRARQLYRDPSHPQRGPLKLRRPRPDRNKPLWIGLSVPTTEDVAPAIQAAHEEILRSYPRRAEVCMWTLNRHDEKKVIAGQNVVLINMAADGVEPHGNSTAWAPAVVARVEPGGARQRPVAFLVRDPDLDRRRFSEVRTAVHDAHGTIDWDLPLEAGPITDAVYALWFSK